MPESKIVYVNEESEDEAELIYGADSTDVNILNPLEENTTNKKSEKDQLVEDKDVVTDEQEQLVRRKGNVTLEKNQLVEDKDSLTDDQEQLVEDKDSLINDQEQLVEDKDSLTNEQEQLVRDEGSVIGGDGYISDPDDASSISSLDTDAILNVDPLYFRLTKFLQTGGSEPENVAEILKKINTNLELMNNNLMNLMNANTSK